MISVTRMGQVLGWLQIKSLTDIRAMRTAPLPTTSPSSADALNELAAKGLRAFYLTERPEWLDARSRELLETNGYPPGILRTTLSFAGASGAAAVAFKSDELTALVGKGMILDWAFESSSIEGDAYDDVNVQPLNHRIFIGWDDPHGGRRVDDWTALPGEFAMLPPICP